MVGYSNAAGDGVSTRARAALSDISNSKNARALGNGKAVRSAATNQRGLQRAEALPASMHRLRMPALQRACRSLIFCAH